MAEGSKIFGDFLDESDRQILLDAYGDIEWGKDCSDRNNGITLDDVMEVIANDPINSRTLPRDYMMVANFSQLGGPISSDKSNKYE